ncbi:MAG TPA: prepilin-type N-terminal cleavage/methylation domain-containing protein, partial [Casimicrobiaceae bacterium]|nr:prepilin-type N-terminal cleavage/methylation domain-containing protein [Casimicrobiaceae bacterium]
MGPVKAGRAWRGGSTPLGAGPSTPLSAGFTLAEILVVLLVIGLAAGLAYARLDADPRQSLEREARRLGGALEHAALLAQWTH